MQGLVRALMQRKLPRRFLTNARRTSTEPIEIKYGISTGNCSWKMPTGGSCALSIKTKMEIRAMQAWLCSDPVGYESLGACPNSRCSILSESDSSLSYEQVFSPLEYRSDTAAAAECAGLRAERPCLAVYR